MMSNLYNNMKFLDFTDDFFLAPLTPSKSHQNKPHIIEITFIQDDNEHTQPTHQQQTHNPQNSSRFIHNMLPLLGDDQKINRNPNSRKPGRYHEYNPNTTKKKITFNDVKGQSEAIKEISEVADFAKNSEKYQAMGAEIPKGILLEGPPGCGKTLIAQALAGETKRKFISTCASSFINKYVGTGADSIRKLFEQARKQAPSIVFIDELDALKARNGDTNEEYHHTLNALLDQLDGFEKNSDVIVVAATNFVKSLDPALVRPGRFDRIIHVGLPTRKGREEIISLYAKKILLDRSLSIDKLSKEFAQRTTAFSGAELKKLVNEAALTACRCKSPHVTKKHFEEAYDKITLGLANNLDRTPQQLRRTACHEAGHATVRYLLGGDDGAAQQMAKISILSRGDALGVAFEKEKYENISEYQKEELLEKIMVLQGGYLAEQIALNCSRPGASSDIKQAYNIASSIAKVFGMGKKEIAHLPYDDKMSPKWKEKYDQEIYNILSYCRNKAEKLLRDNLNKLNALTEELLKKETLNEEEIRKVLATS
jgi:cell division protease FtsH